MKQIFSNINLANVKILLSSSRFQGILGIAVLQLAVILQIITDPQRVAIIEVIQSVIVGAIAVRSVDRIGDKMAEAAQ